MVNTDNENDNCRVYDPERPTYSIKRGTKMRMKLAENAKNCFGIDANKASQTILSMDERTYHIARITLYTAPSFNKWCITCEHLANLSWRIPNHIVLCLTRGKIWWSNNNTFLQDLSSYKNINSL